MRKWSVRLVDVFLCLMFVVACIIMTGCIRRRASTPETLAQSDIQARLDSVTAEVRRQALLNKSPIIPDIPSMTPDKGATGAACMGALARNPDGTPVIVNDKPVYEGAWAIGTSTSMRDVGQFKEAHLILGGWATSIKDGKLPDGAALSGLDLWLVGDSVSSTMNTDFAKVWAAATPAQKEAAAKALAKYYEGRKGMMESIITATGEQVKGVIKEVYSATPIGGALAAVKVLADVAGKPTEGTVVSPFKTNPDGSAAEAAPATGQ